MVHVRRRAAGQVIDRPATLDPVDAQAERVAFDPNLHVTVDMLKRMCRDKPETLDALDQATANPVGSNQYREGVDNFHTL